MTDINAVLLLPRLQVQNANAISGPLTWGFPPPTAFTCFAHALERRLAESSGQRFTGVGIICHQFEPQVSRPNKRAHQVFSLTRNPVYAGWKRFEDKPSALVEEGRAHLEISLLLGIHDYLNEDDRNDLAEEAQRIVQGMRLASGSILPCRDGKRFAAQCLTVASNAEGQRTEFRKLRRRLLPGFALVQREDLLAMRLTEMRVENTEANALDALLDLCSLYHRPPAVGAGHARDFELAEALEPLNAEPGEATDGHSAWTIRQRPGWLVPLPVGYAGISPLYQPGEVANARDGVTPFRFVESLYSLGQWVSPHRIDDLQALLWHTESDTGNGIYRCVNRYAATLPQTTNHSPTQG
jgi:CRISPR-associated protein Csy2